MSSSSNWTQQEKRNMVSSVKNVRDKALLYAGALACPALTEFFSLPRGDGIPAGITKAVLTSDNGGQPVLPRVPITTSQVHRCITRLGSGVRVSQSSIVSFRPLPAHKCSLVRREVPLGGICQVYLTSVISSRARYQSLVSTEPEGRGVWIEHHDLNNS